MSLVSGSVWWQAEKARKKIEEEKKAQKPEQSKPKGAKVKEVKIEEPPKTWTEQFAEFYETYKLPIKDWLAQLFGTPKILEKLPSPPSPLPSPVGVVGSVESNVKGFAHLGVEITPAPREPDVKNILTPPILESPIEAKKRIEKHREWKAEAHKFIGPMPPTASGVATSYLLSPIFGIEQAEMSAAELARWERKYPGYTAATILTDYLISLLIGEAIARSPAGPKLAKAEMEIMSKLRRPIAGSRLDIFLQKHSAYWRQVTEYSLAKKVFGPELEIVTSTSKEPFYIHIKRTRLTPLDTWRKYATKGELILIGIHPPITSQIPEEAFIPTILTPKISYTPFIIGGATVATSKIMQQLQLEVATPQRLKARTKSKLQSRISLEEILKPIIGQVPIQRIAQSQRLIQRQVQQLKLQHQRKKKPEFKPERKKRRKGKQMLFGFYGWIGLEVPVTSPEQLMKMIVGSPTRKRKR